MAFSAAPRDGVAAAAARQADRNLRPFLWFEVAYLDKPEHIGTPNCDPEIEPNNVDGFVFVCKNQWLLCIYRYRTSTTIDPLAIMYFSGGC